MFAMFFGAGNIVFPLALGQFAQNQNFWGMLGLVVTAVFVPLMGLMGMFLYGGNYNKFFGQVGKVPGSILVFLILCLIGPFGGIPRCIAISHATLTAIDLPYLSTLNLLTFSAVVCLLIYLFTCRPARIVPLLGKVLTPFLLLTLGIIVAKGLFVMPHAAVVDHTRFHTFWAGFTEGYNTMDLLASFFFSSIILVFFKSQTEEEKQGALRVALKGGLFAAILLALVYGSFSFLAAGFSSSLEAVASHQLLGALSVELLGPYAGLIVAVLVFFAVLTTMIALTAIFSRFLQEKIFRGKISYPLALVATLATSFAVSILRFDGIAAFVTPILQLCYPALIVLAAANILHKLYNFQYVKLVFYTTLGTTALIQLLA
ncbi:MAG: Branched-chain amino acid transport system 2 carrier protein [Chlamydiales bacterium]|nr:Branched-chain amino acid transport system 2 carrier protein [Chlamydiales bacterium]MCH9619648.1 Branched-chain amino acid transport system 2 carrier protein [Chlamydiales bacterium]MCH9623254.1 Branched-chain amino acid transport system 2 carrier protein [Chlamydiales bacterium]